MIKPEDVTGVGMSLKIDEDLSLFALLAADGSINRLGTGIVDNTEKEMCIGVMSDPTPFEHLRAQISPDLLQWIGHRTDANLKGNVCELTIYLLLPNKEELVMYFKYGSQSTGPPPEVHQLVIAMIELTDPWYEEFKASAGKHRTSQS